MQEMRHINCNKNKPGTMASRRVLTSSAASMSINTKTAAAYERSLNVSPSSLNAISGIRLRRYPNQIAILASRILVPDSGAANTRVSDVRLHGPSLQPFPQLFGNDLQWHYVAAFPR